MPIGGMSFVKEWMVGMVGTVRTVRKVGMAGMVGMVKMVEMVGMELMAHRSNWDHKYKLTILTLYINEIIMKLHEEIDQFTGIYHILFTELMLHQRM